MLFQGYAACVDFLQPLIRLHLRRRMRAGKEDPKRLGERLGMPSIARPGGPIIWIHAASNGESVSAIALVEALRADYPGAHVLFTTFTRSACELLQTKNLPVIHQYIPYDCPTYVARFLDYWKPDVGIFIESDLWPIMIDRAHSRHIPMVYVSGRVSTKSFHRMMALPSFFAHYISKLSLCLMQNDLFVERFRALGAKHVMNGGSIKFSAPPLAFNADNLSVLQKEINGRPVWLAASTHDVEESIIADVHVMLKKKIPDLLTIIVPRHIMRSPTIEVMLAGKGLRVLTRSARQPIHGGVDVYVADTLGELGMFYKLSPIAFIGGTLKPMGGHNPLEAALFDCAILHGPNITNNEEMFVTLDEGGGACVVHDAGALAGYVENLLIHQDKQAAMAQAAKDVAGAYRGQLATIIQALRPYLP